MLPEENIVAAKRPTRRSRRKLRTPLTSALVPTSPPDSPTPFINSPARPDQRVPEREPTEQDQQVPESPQPPEWRLIPLDLDPVRRTRPTRVLLKPGDLRIWRHTSSREDPTIVPSLLSPLKKIPPRPNVSRGVQTSGPEWKYWAIQHAPLGSDNNTQTDP